MPHGVNVNALILPLALPKITLPDPAPVMRAYPGDTLQCSATGTLPIYTMLILNSTVLAKATVGIVRVALVKGGNYSCVATSKYGNDTRVISVIFGKFLC